MAHSMRLPFLLLGALSTGALITTPARAFTTIRMNGSDLTTYDGSFNQNPGFFAPAPSGRMAWWGNSASAEAYARRAGDSLPGNGDEGPYFAYQEANGAVIAWALALNTPGSTSEVFIGKEEGVIYAIQSDGPRPASVPAPLPLFGAAASFAWSRRLRARLRSGTQPGSSPRASRSTSASWAGRHTRRRS